MSQGQAGSDGRRETQPDGQGELEAGQGETPRRRRGGHPGAAAHARVDRSPLAVREELREPEAGR